VHIKEPSSFKEQLSTKHTIEVGGKMIEYVRLCPDKITSEVPIIFAPGLSENPELLENLFHKLYNDGRIIYTTAHPRIKMDVELNGHPPAQEQKIATIATLINVARTTEPILEGKVDLVGRSDGGVNAALAAIKNPEYIENLILIDTKLIPAEKATKLARRFLEHFIMNHLPALTHSEGRDHVVDGILGGIEYTRPLGQSSEEVYALAASDIRPLLQQLRAQGIGVYGIHGTSDRIFPMKDTQNALLREDKELDGYFDGFYSVGPIKKKDSPAYTVYKQEDGTEIKISIDYTPINHISIFDNTKYINVISYALKAARAKTVGNSTMPLSG
jgi:pimeloyl-ACP methyl ester carboxylesterase